MYNFLRVMGRACFIAYSVDKQFTELTLVISSIPTLAGVGIVRALQIKEVAQVEVSYQYKCHRNSHSCCSFLLVYIEFDL